MSQLTRKSALFRFRCSKCNIRLKVDAVNRGKPIVCPQCKNVIVAERHTQNEIPEESIIQRLDESVDQWVRTQCTCGKLIKAPAAFAGRTGHCPQCSRPITMPELGETFSSSIEVSTFVEAPSEESLLMAVGGDEALEEIQSEKEVTYSRLSPVEQEPEEPQFVRAACVCGAEVHAALNMAGKTVRCPKCDTLLYLPSKPLKRPIFDFDAMGRKDLNFNGESIVFKPHMISGGQDLFKEIDASKEIKVAVTQSEWDHEKQVRALKIRSIRGDNPLQIKLRAFALAVTNTTAQVKKTLWGTQLSALITNSVVLLAAVILFIIQYNLYWLQPGNNFTSVQLPTQIQFYDIGDTKLFYVSSDTLPPISAPSQGGVIDGNFYGVRAYLFGCDGCGPDKETFVGLLESMTDATRNGYKRKMEITGVPKVPSLFDLDSAPNPGRLISMPKPIHWVEAASPQGITLMESATHTKCPNGRTADLCNP